MTNYAFISPWQVVPLNAVPTTTYDVSTFIGRVRLLIPDRDITAPIFTDAELGGFAAIEGDDARLVAAAALETMAAHLLYQVGDYRVEDLQTNASKTAAAYMQRAQALREQSQLEDSKSGATFDWAEMVTDPFTARERLRDQRLRGVV